MRAGVMGSAPRQRRMAASRDRASRKVVRIAQAPSMAKSSVARPSCWTKRLRFRMGRARAVAASSWFSSRSRRGAARTSSSSSFRTRMASAPGARVNSKRPVNRDRGVSRCRRSASVRSNRTLGPSVKALAWRLSSRVITPPTGRVPSPMASVEAGEPAPTGPPRSPQLSASPRSTNTAPEPPILPSLGAPCARRASLPTRG